MEYEEAARELEEHGIKITKMNVAQSETAKKFDGSGARRADRHLPLPYARFSNTYIPLCILKYGGVV
jgi:hypothetical protein